VAQKAVASRPAVDALTSAFERPLHYVAALRAAGHSVIGTSSPAVPAELLRAAGCESVVLRWATAPTPMADARLEPGVFSPFIRALVEAAFTGELSSLRALVMPRSSEQQYKAYLYLREFAREKADGFRCPVLLLYDLLQSDSSEVRAYVLSRTQALAGDVQALTGRPWSAEELASKIAEANGARAAARRLLNLRRSALISSTEAMPMLGARHVMTPGEYTRLANAAADELSTRPVLAGPRLLLAGEGPDNLQLHAVLESHGTVVVGEDSPWGSRGVGPDVSMDPDALTAVAEHYYRHGDGSRRPGETDDVWFEEALTDADGVVFWLPSSDGVRGWDYPRWRQRASTHGIPHLLWRGDAGEVPPSLTTIDLAAFLDAAAKHASRRDA
jgi:benzoyl-CoA reductase/2-hydroxyglutaryl-CoA dehydratase subunit BcrC/BadD/HgdB